MELKRCVALKNPVNADTLSDPSRKRVVIEAKTSIPRRDPYSRFVGMFAYSRASLALRLWIMKELVAF